MCTALLSSCIRIVARILFRTCRSQFTSHGDQRNSYPCWILGSVDRVRRSLHFEWWSATQTRNRDRQIYIRPASLSQSGGCGAFSPMHSREAELHVHFNSPTSATRDAVRFAIACIYVVAGAILSMNRQPSIVTVRNVSFCIIETSRLTFIYGVDAHSQLPNCLCLQQLSLSNLLAPLH